MNLVRLGKLLKKIDLVLYNYSHNCESVVQIRPNLTNFNFLTIGDRAVPNEDL